MDEATARQALADLAHRLDREGLNHGATGNLSVRIDRGVLVSPTGIPSADVEPDDAVALALDGTPLDADGRAPTSEWRLHAALHRQGAQAVVHTHSPEATAAATLRRAVPAVHYAVARFGGTVLPCAPYATYGSQELADAVAATLGDRFAACLMANHGAVATGPDLETAASLATEVEWLCGIWRRARQLGDPAILDDAEIARVAARLATYGQPR